MAEAQEEIKQTVPQTEIKQMFFSRITEGTRKQNCAALLSGIKVASCTSN